MDPRNFFTELKRRNVYKVAVAYAVAGWLVIQVSSTVLPMFHAPEWVVQTLVVLVVLGFPIALVIAWAFELTPEGIKRTEDVDRATTERQARKHAWIFVVIIGALLSIGLFLLGRFTVSAKHDAAADIPSSSIAVLPFVNMSSDRENEYFVDGLTEEILNRLAQVGSLRVPGRTSSFAFKGTNTDLRQVGAALGVAHVLEGSVRKSGDRLRITAELVRAKDGFHLWSQRFDRKLDDVFAIQEEIAHAIADALSTPLALGDATRLQHPTKDMNAYDNFLQARALMTDRTADKLRRALELLTAAVDRDPQFARGWAALAQARALSFYFLSEIADPLKGAEEAARKALAVDDSIAMAHSALADVLRDRYDWRAAETEYQRALKLSPGEVETHNQYAQMLLRVGYVDAALHHGLRACELDPLAWVPPSVIALAYLCKDDFVKSRDFLDRSEKISGRTRGFHARLELLYALSRKDRDLARRGLALARPRGTWSSNPPSPQFIGVLDQALAGSSESVLDLGKALTEIRAAGLSDSGVPASAVAVFVGQKAAALDELLAEAEIGGNDVTAVIWTPVYRTLWKDPRFHEFLTTQKLPEYWRAAGWNEFCRPQGENDFECVAP